ncbi:MAG: ABC transporter permease subunit [Oscillospiraceae bacterium]|nr:ABC transporter permease subunit [Oscillospiraceae bacterium]
MTAPDTYVLRRGRMRIHNPYYTRPLNIFLLCFAAAGALSMAFMPMDWAKVFSRVGGLGEILSRLATVSLNNIDVTLRAFAESVWVAVLSTVYSALLGLVFGALTARNISPIKPLAPILSAVFTFIRAVPTFIWVLLIIVCLGLGPAPAIAGVCVHSTAFFARSFAQAFEEADGGVLDALAATGSNSAKVFFTAVFPSTLTSVTAWLTLRFEINFRESYILGMVGAGGIGYTLSSYFRGYHYGEGMTAVIIIVAFTYLTELLANRLKKKLQ